LGRVDGRIRSFRKERGWTPTGEQQIENRMQDQLVASTCRRCRASIRHHRRRVTLTAVPLRRSYTGNLSGMTVAAWTLALPSCPGAHAVPLSTWHYGGPTRSTPLRGRDKSPAVVMPIEAFNRGATKACADHRNSVRTMPINKSRRSGWAPGLALRNRSASYIGGAAAPGSRDHSAPALACGASAATMARSRCVWIRCASLSSGKSRRSSAGPLVRGGVRPRSSSGFRLVASTISMPSSAGDQTLSRPWRSAPG
jgi:hypothetical protein